MITSDYGIMLLGQILHAFIIAACTIYLTIIIKHCQVAPLCIDLRVEIRWLVLHSKYPDESITHLNIIYLLCVYGDNLFTLFLDLLGDSIESFI